MWMTVGDPRRRYPIRPSNDRLPCFCVSTAPVFPLARAGSTRGFSAPVLGPRVPSPSFPSSFPPTLPLFSPCLPEYLPPYITRLSLPGTDQDQEGTHGGKEDRSISDVQTTITEVDSSFTAWMHDEMKNKKRRILEILREIANIRKM